MHACIFIVFLYLVNYHQLFINYFAQLSVPLYLLTWKGKFSWGPEQKEAFIGLIKGSINKRLGLSAA